MLHPTEGIQEAALAHIGTSHQSNLYDKIQSLIQLHVMLAAQVQRVHGHLQAQAEGLASSDEARQGTFACMAAACTRLSC